MANASNMNNENLKVPAHMTLDEYKAQLSNMSEALDNVPAELARKDTAEIVEQSRDSLTGAYQAQIEAFEQANGRKPNPDEREELFKGVMEDFALTVMQKQRASNAEAIEMEPEHRAKYVAEAEVPKEIKEYIDNGKSNYLALESFNKGEAPDVYLTNLAKIDNMAKETTLKQIREDDRFMPYMKKKKATKRNTKHNARVSRLKTLIKNTKDKSKRMLKTIAKFMGAELYKGEFRNVSTQQIKQNKQAKRALQKAIRARKLEQTNQQASKLQTITKGSLNQQPKATSPSQAKKLEGMSALNKEQQSPADKTTSENIATKTQPPSSSSNKSVNPDKLSVKSPEQVIKGQPSAKVADGNSATTTNTVHQAPQKTTDTSSWVISGPMQSTQQYATQSTTSSPAPENQPNVPTQTTTAQDKASVPSPQDIMRRSPPVTTTFTTQAPQNPTTTGHAQHNSPTTTSTVGASKPPVMGR